MSSLNGALHNRAMAAEECDATGDDSSNPAWYISTNYTVYLTPL